MALLWRSLQTRFLSSIHTNTFSSEKKNTSGCVFVYHPHLNADNNGYFCKLIEKKCVMETYRFCNAPFIVGTREAFGNVDLKCVTYCRFQLGFRMFGREMCPFQIKTRIKWMITSLRNSCLVNKFAPKDNWKHN